MASTFKRNLPLLFFVTSNYFSPALRSKFINFSVLEGSLCGEAMVKISNENFGLILNASATALLASSSLSVAM